MPSFWETLKTSGAQMASKVVQPLGAGIGQGISNLVQQGQNKVSQLAQTVVQTTNPNKPTASQPAAPPTTGSPPVPAGKTAAQTQASMGVVMVIAVIVLILYMRGRK